MRNIRMAAATLAATGLAAFGAVAVSGGVANAVTGQGITGCSLGASLLTVGVTPTCAAETGTIDNSTAITYTVDSSFLAAVPGSAVTVNSTLACVVNGTTVSVPTPTFTATGTTNTQSLDLQALVGSPEPNNCQVQSLTATATAVLGASLGTGVTFGVTATGDNSTPGAIYQDEGTAGSGAVATACVDDTGNGDGGTPAQSWACLADLGQGWVVTAGGQIAHNGDCLQDAGTIILEACNGSATQAWTVNGTGGAFNTIVNTATGHCLTNANPAEGNHLTGTTCSGAADQLWTAP